MLSPTKPTQVAWQMVNRVGAHLELCGGHLALELDHFGAVFLLEPLDIRRVGLRQCAAAVCWRRSLVRTAARAAQTVDRKLGERFVIGKKPPSSPVLVDQARLETAPDALRKPSAGLSQGPQKPPPQRHVLRGFQ